MDQLGYSRLLGLVGFCAGMIFIANFMLCMYYIPFGAGIVPGIESPDIYAAERSFRALGYTMWGILGFVLMMFGQCIEPMEMRRNPTPAHPASSTRATHVRAGDRMERKERGIEEETDEGGMNYAERRSK